MRTEDRAEIVRLDKARVWHPYTASDAWEKEDPIVVARAHGSRLFEADGRSYLDGNSSWWVAALGHGHPRLLRVLREQSETLVHCALAGIAHENAARLADELIAISPPGLSRVFYTDNGSGSIEVAVKVCVQAWKQRGKPDKIRFVALDGAYHGDTIGATSLGGVDIFKRPYAGVLFECVRAPFPEDDAHAQAFAAMRAIVERDAKTIAAVVVEPMVQGAAGMRMYSASFLKELRDLCTANDVLLVIDEVFAGYGRTGKMWASEHAGVTPDVMCIGKVFSTLLPMAAALVTEDLFDAFRGGKDRALFYGHTFCGHPLGAALAREVLAIYRDEKIIDQVSRKSPVISRSFQTIREIPGVSRVRSLGMIGACDLATSSSYTGTLGWRVYEEARRRGAYLRPLGDTVYVCPPLVISDEDLAELLTITTESIRKVMSET